MRILPNAFCPAVKEAIDIAREHYPVAPMQLNSTANVIRGYISAHSREIVAGELVDGKQYGIFDLSPMASAYSKKTGKWMNHHGDLYVTVWTWKTEIGKFVCFNAWGGMSEKNPAVITEPLIEL